MSDINLGNLYEINKMAMVNNFSKMNSTVLNDKLREIKKYFKQDYKYHMLLCHEKRDYTVFVIKDHKNDICIKEAVAALKDCMINRGTVLDIEQQPDGAYEIWLKIDEEAFCYYLFPYDQGIIVC